MSAISDQERAERSSEAMLKDDHTTKGMGMSIDAVGPGTATLSMTVRKDHLNGHGSCHGGAIFTLADSAFAFACNSRGQRTVAQTNTITYLAAGKVGDRLTARAREVQLRGKSGIYDVTVTREDGTVIAEFRGQSRAIPGSLFDSAGERQ